MDIDDVLFSIWNCLPLDYYPQVRFVCKRWYNLWKKNKKYKLLSSIRTVYLTSQDEILRRSMLLDVEPKTLPGGIELKLPSEDYLLFVRCKKEPYTSYNILPNKKKHGRAYFFDGSFNTYYEGEKHGAFYKYQNEKEFKILHYLKGRPFIIEIYKYNGHRTCIYECDVLKRKHGLCYSINDKIRKTFYSHGLLKSSDREEINMDNYDHDGVRRILDRVIVH
jgi:hypothetical protein